MTQVQKFPGIFKKTYKDLKNLLPKGFKGQEKIRFDESAKIGDEYVIGVVLSYEGGGTFAGSDGSLVTFNAATAGSVQQAKVKAYEIDLPSNIPFKMIEASQSSEAAMAKAPALLVKNNLVSHQHYRETALWYGQSSSGLGNVAYIANGVSYRGVAASADGDIVLNGVTFVDGVDTTNKHILIQPGQFAPGVWVGREGTPIQQVATSDDSIVGSGKIVAVNAKYGYITVDFTPVVATSATSHKLVWPGWEEQQEMVGIKKILSNTGTLFNIDASKYGLWKGTQFPAGSKKPNLKLFLDAHAEAVNNGFDGEMITFFVNPKAFAKIAGDEAELRRYNAGVRKAENGFDAIEFFGPEGALEIVPYRMIMEGESYGLHLPDWMRPGNSEPAMKVNGMSGELITPLENQNGYRFLSHSDSAVICSAPAKSVYVSGIDIEASSFYS